MLKIRSWLIFVQDGLERTPKQEENSFKDVSNMFNDADMVEMYHDLNNKYCKIVFQWGYN